MVDHRRLISNKEKHSLVLKVNQQIATGSSLRAACRENNISPNQFRKWRKPEVFDQLLNSRRGAYSLHQGRVSVLQQFEDEIVQWLFQHREQGMPISIRMIVLKAGELDPDFRRKSDASKYAAVYRFARIHRWALRIGTHVSQRRPAEVIEEGKDFVNSIRPLLTCSSSRSQDYILNMDQTPVFFSMTPGTTIEQQGMRTVNIRRSGGSTMRATAAVTVTASGKMLPLMMVFKGKPNGRIEREFRNYPVGAQYAVQDRAWMDERVMLLWVEQVLRPYVETAPNGIQPFILLDSYRCHMMSSVVTVIQDLGVQVEHIPGGCTGLCQPLDVGINKPMKTRCRNKWEQWMMTIGMEQAITKQPSRQEVSQWCIESVNELPTEIIKNSWRHGDYSYFPNS